MEIFKREDHVTVSLAGKTVDAIVQLASPNGVSLMLMFEDFLGGYMMFMPVFYSEERGCFTDLIESREVIIKRKI